MKTSVKSVSHPVAAAAASAVMVALLLAGLGYEVDAAADGEPAFGRLRQRGSDLVLTDLELPGMNGF